MRSTRRRPTARANSLLAVSLLVASLLTAASLAGCQRAAATPLFALAGSLRSCAEPSQPLGQLPASVRQRALTRAADALWYWNQADGSLVRSDLTGLEQARWPLPAGAAWLQGNSLLARAETFADGQGFEFALYRLEPATGPRRLAEWYLDCFPSDLCFLADGSVLLAGADQADRWQRLYRLSGDGRRQDLGHLPRQAGFVRLVPLGERLLVFESGSQKAKGDLTIHLLEPGQSLAEAANLTLALPADALCWYGYGFTWQADAYLPFARADGSIGLARWNPATGQLGILADCGGVSLPLGASSQDSAYYYLAFDYYQDPTRYRLARIDAAGLGFQALE
ncbi:MAG TPA: hypothetical protein DCY05_07945 [Spirochaetaceae bacterium]|nr:hypothetical protein [Spirochaetaceae bacterium]